MQRQIGSIALAAAVILIGVAASVPAARAEDECLAAPNAQAPKGSHWYYRLDRAKQRKCWYMRAQNPAPQQAAQQALPENIAAAQPLPLEASKYAADDSVAPPAQGQQRAVKPRPAVSGALPTATFQPAPTAQQAPTFQQAPTAQQTLTAQQTPADTAAEPDAAPQPAAPAPAAGVAWPDPGAQIQTLRRPEPAPIDARADAAPVRPLADARAATDAPRPTPAVETAGMGGFLSLTPLGIVLIGGIGLAMAGLLTRAVVRIASLRRRRIYVEPSEAHWNDDHSTAPMHAYAPPLNPADGPVEHQVPSLEEVEVALRDILRAYDRRPA